MTIITFTPLVILAVECDNRLIEKRFGIMKIIFGGGASEVGASFIMVRIDGKNIVLDCGIRMSGDPLPDLNAIKEHGSADCIILSHAHLDHSGALPVLSREYLEPGYT